MLLQAMHDIICNSVALFLSQLFAEPANKLAGAS